MLNGLRPHGICNKKLWDSSAANPRSPWCRGLPFVKVTKCADPQAFNLKNKSKLKYFWALRREKRETKSTRSKKMEEATKGSPANFILAPSCTSASQKCWPGAPSQRGVFITWPSIVLCLWGQYLKSYQSISKELGHSQHALLLRPKRAWPKESKQNHSWQGKLEWIKRVRSRALKVSCKGWMHDSFSINYYIFQSYSLWKQPKNSRAQ